MMKESGISLCLGFILPMPRHTGWFRIAAVCFALFAVSSHALGAQPSNAADGGVEGLWLAQDHDGVFEIGKCGERLCGRLIGMDYDKHEPKDVWGRPECGLVMLTGFMRQDDGRWHGNILDPETGKTYDAMIWSPSSEVLKLRGYILGISLFGETQTWTRYHGPAMGPNCKLPRQGAR